AHWFKEKVKKDEVTLVEADPPHWSIFAVMGRGVWPGLRYLSGIVEAPTLRADGTVLDVAGYDEATGLLYEPNARYPRVPAAPGADAARRAAETLFDLVSEFEFVGDEHRAAWLAALLSVLARPAINGPCPLFLFEAAAPGTGKTLLAEVIGIIVAGR